MFNKKNLQLLATEIFKSKAGVSPELMNDIFHFVESLFNLRSDYTIGRKQDHTVYHGSENISSLAPKLWDLLPNSIKNSVSPKEFKTKINTWAFDCCPCTTCTKYVWDNRIHLNHSIGFALLVLWCFYLTICI